MKKPLGFRATVPSRFHHDDCPKDCGGEDGFFCENPKYGFVPRAIISETVLSLTIPLGPTDNRRHTIAARRRILIDTEEYRTWKDDAIREIKNQLPKDWKPIKGSEKNQIPYRIQVVLLNRRTDAANYIKGIQDVLTHAGVWTDDKWACPQFYPARVVAERGRIIVTLPMTDAARCMMWPQPLA